MAIERSNYRLLSVIKQDIDIVIDWLSLFVIKSAVIGDSGNYNVYGTSY